MTTLQLQEYVKGRRAAGAASDAIRSELVASGWAAADIDAALGGTPAAPAPSAMPVMPRKPRAWLIVVPVVLLLAAGGAFAYLKFFAASPDAVLASALNSAMYARSAEYAGSLRIELTLDPEAEKGATAGQTLALVGAGGEPGKPAKLLLTFDGAFDRLDPTKPKTRGSYTLASTEAADGAPLGTLETRNVDGVTYLSLSRVPTTPLFDLSSLAGVWVKFDPQAIAGMFGSASATVKTAERKELTAEQRTAVEKAFVETRPISVTEKLADEEVAGAASRHYRLSLDKTKFREFLTSLQQALGETDSLAYEKLADEYDKFEQEVEVQAFEVWIGKESGQLARLKLQASAKESEDVPGQGVFTLDMTFKGFGQPVAIEAPPEVKTIEEVIGTLMSGATGGFSSVEEAGPSSAQRISTARQIMTGLELAFSENDRYPLIYGTADLRGIEALCMADGKLAWATRRSDCTGQVYLETEYFPEFAAPNGYVFTGSTGRWYEIRFELEESAGDLTAGPQCANPNGIVSGSDCKDGDQDRDGYGDYAELEAGYDPFGPGKLSDFR